MKHEGATNPAYTDEFIQWFWDHVNKTPCCWLWTPTPPVKPFRGNYVIIRVGKKTMGVHRISYELTNGDIPQGIIVCHRCDNPPCVRPDHLFLGTHSDNMKDCIRKGRRDVYHQADDGIVYIRVSLEYKATKAGITVEELQHWIEQGMVEAENGPFGPRYTVAAILRAKERLSNK